MRRINSVNLLVRNKQENFATLWTRRKVCARENQCERHVVVPGNIYRSKYAYMHIDGAVSNIVVSLI